MINAFLHMSFCAGLLTAVILLLRALFIKRLPKELFRLLWAVAAARMIIPFSLPVLPSHDIPVRQMPQSSISAPSEPKQIMPEDTAGQPPIVYKSMESMEKSSPRTDNDALPQKILLAVYLLGFAVSAAYFIRDHRRLKKSCAVSLPAQPEYITYKKRRIRIRISDETLSPLTYGIFRPTILLPEKQYSRGELRYILAHETEHIRRYDTLLKHAIAFAVCLHWFDPLSWIMLLISQRDIELACDEAVLNRLGGRKEYAMTLIGIAETGVPTAAAFGGNSVKERIEMIMKHKKTTIAAAAVSVCIALGSMAVFAAESRPQQKDSSDNTVSRAELTAAEENSADDSQLETSSEAEDTSTAEDEEKFSATYTFVEDADDADDTFDESESKELTVEYSEDNGKGSLVYKDADGNIIEQMEGTPEELGMTDEGITIGEFNVEFDGSSITGGIAQGDNTPTDTDSEISVEDKADYLKNR